MITSRANRTILCVALCVILGLAGCASKQGYSGKVLITNGPLPAGIRHDVIGEIDVVKRHGYGGADIANRMLADKAREIGANAVVNARFWVSPVVLGSRAAPHGHGLAVRVHDRKALEELGTKGGKWE